ncbi:MAG: DUF4380 domain-containing protein, partial [Planctomycetota bacterium]
TQQGLSRLVVCLCLLAGLVSGCMEQRSLVVLKRGRMEVMYDPGKDRIFHFAPVQAPNAMHIGSDAFCAATGKYIFRGGSYTWLAPQSEWLNAQGKPIKWPPEPGADFGPMTVLAASAHEISVRGPVLRRGMHEEKRYLLNSDDSMTLNVALVPDRPPCGSFSIWSITTADLGSVIAVPGRATRFSKAEFGAAWAAASRQVGPWLLVDTGKMDARGKAFVEGAAVVGVWSRGQWFVRVGSDHTAPRHEDDTPVEIYISTRRPKIEIELIAPYLPADTPGQNTWSETWYILKADKPSTEILPPFIPQHTLR